MENNYKFTIDIDELTTHQSGVKRGTNGVYKTKKYISYENKLVYLFLKNHKELPKLNDNQYLKIDCKFLFKIEKAKSKTNKEKSINKPYVKKKDLDNLFKGVGDCLAHTYGFDDSKIVELNLSKFYQDDIIKDYNTIELNIQIKEA